MYATRRIPAWAPRAVLVTVAMGFALSGAVWSRGVAHPSAVPASLGPQCGGVGVVGGLVAPSGETAIARPCPRPESGRSPANAARHQPPPCHISEPSPVGGQDGTGSPCDRRAHRTVAAATGSDGAGAARAEGRTDSGETGTRPLAPGAPDLNRYCSRTYRGSQARFDQTRNGWVCVQPGRGGLGATEYRVNLAAACRLTTGRQDFRYQGDRRVVRCI